MQNIFFDIFDMVDFFRFLLKRNKFQHNNNNNNNNSNNNSNNNLFIEKKI